MFRGRGASEAPSFSRSIERLRRGDPTPHYFANEYSGSAVGWAPYPDLRRFEWELGGGNRQSAPRGPLPHFQKQPQSVFIRNSAAYLNPADCRLPTQDEAQGGRGER